MGAVHKLEMSKERLRNAYHPGKERDFDQVRPELKETIEALCAGVLRWPLFLHGTVGSGKSCAALCMVDRVAKSEFWPMPTFIDHVWNVRQGKAFWRIPGHGGTLTSKQWWQSVTNMPMLVLDDVGLREVPSDSHMEVLFMALEARDGKPMICTSNLNPKEIEISYNDRIRSRLCSGTMFELRGRDRRYLEGENP